ncbi:MAG: hypothetical protein ABR576_05400 [Thermoanaerobaculia bacterium]
MPQTRIFRDRIVSMEQTLEGGEKHLELLKTLCREALPEFEYVEHALDHERDLFTMTLRAPDGRTRVVGWTRMVLFDPERIPVLLSEPASPLRDRLLQFLRSRAGRPEILVTFRHMEDGWIDTPEPRRDKRRRRRGRPERREPGRRPEKAVARKGEGPRSPAAARPAAASRPAGAPRPAAAEASGAPPAQGTRPAGRRRFRRRRRGGRGGGTPAGPAPQPS